MIYTICTKLHSFDPDRYKYYNNNNIFYIVYNYSVNDAIH